ncbi:transcription-repair coupling factor [Enorma massiliensis]|uniref:transcription-repair coupling factor n=1 Tax=Enorma massiliensis TaxID=1472761 RepID=UPI003AF08C27
MNGLIASAKKIEEYGALLDCVKNTRLPIGMTGLSHIHKAHFAAALNADCGRPVLVITADEAQASRLALDMKTLGCRALLYPARDFAFRSTESQSREYEHRRLGVLDKMLRGEAQAVICSAEAASQLTLPPEELRNRTIELAVGDEMPLEDIVKALLRAGYSRSAQVDGVGQYAVRGGVLDFFTPGEEYPCRLELWGDEIDSMAYFDIETQRRTDNIEKIKITPSNEILPPDTDEFVELLERFRSEIRGKGAVKARECVDKDIDRIKGGLRLQSTDKYMPLLYDVASIFDYAKGFILCVSESFSVKERFNAAIGLMHEAMKAMFEEGELCPGLDRFSLHLSDLLNNYEQMGAIYMDNLPRGGFDTPVKELIGVNARQITAWNGSFSVLKDDLDALTDKTKRTCVIFAGTRKAADALRGDLIDDGYSALYMDELPNELAPGTLTVVPGCLSAGFEYPLAKITVFTHSGRAAVAQPKRNVRKSSNAFHSLDELHRGDYVVHVAHGIGIFEGINKLEASGTIKDYIKIRYDKGDILYVPVTQLDQVSKYIGPSGDDKPVRLNKLGGKDWQKTRSRVRSAVKDMAKELTELYSRRLKIEGHAFSPDTDMQSDFERRFEFDETSDQLRCIDEIKGDMERSCPMDRLLCGDVGFGKTEVALRAAMKCMLDGKQVAILVPTTVLAQQHYLTAMRRFATFPVTIDVLSRFRTPAQIKKTLFDLQSGKIDLIVGTHKLLQKDIHFHDLGLLIVDEEQRFGVTHKERLKELSRGVDVLTLSATPIPRTLNMALSGLRDMSTIEQPPQDRYPVQTFVLEHQDGILDEAMRRELARGGQVYYLHNRVESIDQCAAKIKQRIPEAEVAVAHGKMNEEQLGDVMQSMSNGEIQILVCTTIIETGIDIPNVNTLIIEDADRLGLAQLHQIRGRVGRSSRHAYAYLTFRKGKVLSEIAEKRLDTIREYAEFGSGFKIAMRDLEIRGAGDLLGAEQSGHMMTVGYDMYLKLLEDAVLEERGEAAQKEPECTADLTVTANINKDYVASGEQRMDLYRRMAAIRTQEDADELLDEIVDRFGDPPKGVMNLIAIALLRARAAAAGITEITQKDGAVLLSLSTMDFAAISACCAEAQFKGRIFFSAGKVPMLSVKLKKAEDPLKLATQLVGVYAALRAQTAGA